MCLPIDSYYFYTSNKCQHIFYIDGRAFTMISLKRKTSTNAEDIENLRIWEAEKGQRGELLRFHERSVDHDSLNFAGNMGVVCHLTVELCQVERTGSLTNLKEAEQA